MPIPAVAVITRTKNRPLLLPRAMQSVVNQTFKDLIWVVVNDGGDPAPVQDVVAKAREAGIHTVQIDNAQSIGMEAASNLGCRSCESRYIAIHDDDDTWEPTYLEKMVAYLDQNPDLCGAISGTNEVRERLTPDSCEVVEKKPYNEWLKAIYMVDMLQRNQFAPIAFLFPRTVYEQVEGFDENLPVLGDWDFALKVLQLGDIGVFPERLANYHLRPPELQQAKDEYANTVTHHIDVHARYDAYIRNKWMRDDISKGRFGIGMMMGLGRQHGAMLYILYGYREALLQKQAEEKNSQAEKVA
ncbi:MAG: glycosyltransferase [Proteobacteria bacterium]|nr:glycosyltransferase [Pseudomonadota bacterium]